MKVIETEHVSSGRVGASLVIVLTLMVLAGVILAGRQRLRETVRDQIARRDAQVLLALWQSQFENDEVILASDDPATHFVTLLETSRLTQLSLMRGARLFNRAGGLEITVPPEVADATLRPEDLEELRRLRPVSRFYIAPGLESILPGEERVGAGPVPLLEVSLPIHLPGGGELLGVAQFILDGSGMAEEFRELDRSLWRQSALAFLAGGSLVASVLAFAFHRLRRSHQLVLERTQSLLQANQELALAAKTSAVGALTSHLIHGLKNPLSGLQSYISARGSGPDESDGDWQMAISTTRRMQNLISEVVRVLREEDGSAQYEVSIQELNSIIESKMQPLAHQAGVELRFETGTEAVLTNRNANLLVLILENLMQNAIQATPTGGRVDVICGTEENRVVWQVRDAGPGLPGGYLQQLFKPCQSTKERGSGIGLAISKQLANYLGVELELRETSAAGTVFAVVMPDKLFLRNGLKRSEAVFN